MKGARNKVVPLYEVVTNPHRWSNKCPAIDTNGMTELLTDRDTDINTNLLTDVLTIHKDKDNYKDKDIIINGPLCELEEIEKILLSDVKWHDNLQKLLTQDHAKDVDISDSIRAFFRELRCKPNTQYSENGCKAYFVNWIKKHLNQTANHYGTTTDKRRCGGYNLPTSSPDDYEGAF